MKHIEAVLTRKKEAKLKVKITQSEFAQKIVKYVIHIVRESQGNAEEAKICTKVYLNWVNCTQK